jgi:hypothetical protein
MFWRKRAIIAENLTLYNGDALLRITRGSQKQNDGKNRERYRQA